MLRKIAHSVKESEMPLLLCVYIRNYRANRLKWDVITIACEKYLIKTG